MRVQFILLLFLNLLLIPVFAGTPPHNFEMGKSAEQWKADLKDVSNVESWEETRFEYAKPVVIYGIPATKTELGFYNKRLFEVTFILPMDAWNTLKQNLDKEYGPAWTADTTKAEKSGQWGEVNNGVFMYQINGIGTTMVFSDAAQKDFQFSDLFHGVLLWVIVSIVGLFVFNMLIGWMLTSWCKKCKTFNMKVKGVTHSNYKDYNSDVLGTRDVHSDTTYKFKCSKCGHERKDRYSGFMSYMRSKD